MQAYDKLRWVPFIPDDLDWLDSMLAAEYFSCPQGVDGDILRAKVIEKCIRLKRTVVAEKLRD